MSMRRVVEPMLRPIKQRIMSIVARAVVESVNDAGGLQIIKASLLEGEVRDGLERVQNFGLSSNPPNNSEAIAVFFGGNRENGFILGCEHRDTRPKDLAKGETVLYSSHGTEVRLSEDGTVNVKGTKVVIESGEVEVGSGTLESVMLGETFQSLFNAHTHPESVGSVTGPPSTPLAGSELSGSVKVAK